MDLPSSGRPKEFAFFPMRNFKTYEAPKLPIEEPNTDFKRKYPADMELGQELADNARVWKVYRDEAMQHDDGLLDGWNNTIDILLTFAGLFSAAVTAFVVESYQFLQPGTLDLGAALYALAVNDTAMLHSLATSSSQPSSPARWINGLWFTSLFFSLVAAFLCILVKQWLDEYKARTRASSQNPKHWSRRRAFYFRAVDSWGVPVIISLLPLLLHAALFLFFAGMVVLLWSLNRAVAGWLSGLALLALLLYLVSLLIPVWDAACPFATPLARLLRRLWTPFWAWALRHAGFASELAAAAVFRFQHVWTNQSPLGAVCPHPRSIRCWTSSKAFHDTHDKSFFDQVIHFDSLRSHDDRGLTILDVAMRDELDCDALCWLIFSVSDNDAGAVGFQALGAAEPYSPLAERLIARGVARASQQRLLSNSNWSTPAQVAPSLVLWTTDGTTTGGWNLGNHIPTFDFFSVLSSYPSMHQN
ncbi:hypothetical protein EXIGLDRAFT_838617 [Exidia glandulosa HHB12029]|uniref:DUF6535 domain-containing protein n=1 Tax=Exidia glandulosa HHB12029 TaxID=1314781 RepID=A0A165FP91_EXIGL|nr:hypothetical protein EXIGLDRAFT_838617 [Exidia glandulosa HHB12029]